MRGTKITVHLSTLPYAKGKAVLCGREMWPNGAFHDGHIIADRDCRLLLPGEQWCEECLHRREQANDE